MLALTTKMGSCELDEKISELRLMPSDSAEFSPLEEGEIVAIEKYLNVRFSDGYRSFLLKYGASEFGEYAHFPTLGGGVAPGRFFGRDLPDRFEDFRDRLPSAIIPINDDVAQNLLCISARSESFGAIAFQSHSVGSDGENASEEERDHEKLKTLSWLSADFESFISSLEPEADI